MLTVNPLFDTMQGMPSTDRGQADVAGMVDRWLSRYRSPNTRQAYRRDLDVFTSWIAARGTELLAADRLDVTRFRDELTDAAASTATVNRRLSSLSAFFTYAQDAGLCAANPVTSTTRVEHDATSNTAQLDAQECLIVWKAALATGAKAATIVGLLLYDGLKLHEMLAADLVDTSTTGTRSHIEIERHGRRQRITLHAATTAAVRTYARGRSDGPMLLGDSPSRTPTRLTRYGAHFVIRQVGERARLGRPLTANQLRSSYIANAYASGVHIDDIQLRAGHVDNRATSRHLPRGEV